MIKYHSPFLTLVANRLRRLDYALRTEQTYINWIKQYIIFNNKRHPSELGRVEMEGFLTHLVVKRQVSASTQNQALSALVFMYKQVLDMDYRVKPDNDGWRWVICYGLSG